MNLNNLKKAHIIGIGGCASSAIAEFLKKNKITVTGSEIKKTDELKRLENIGIKIFYNHDKNNIHYDKIPDVVLYSPAVIALNPDNPELQEAKKLNILTSSWEEFIGKYFDAAGMKGITVCGSEGKGTTAGILTKLLKGTEFDPISILGAKLKKINGDIDSNIYLGSGKTYILEGDEYNRNFYSYYPSINIMLNFEFEHPETYKDFDDYKEAFYNFFKNMKDEKLLILRASDNIIKFIDKYKIDKTHDIIWFEKEENLNDKKNKNCFIIKNHIINEKGNFFNLIFENNNYDFFIPALPGYMVYNAVGAVIAAFKLGLKYETIKENLLNFTGMVRRFDIYNTKNNGAIITDYGHSPEAVNHIIKEIRLIYKNKKIHMIFQPHLYSRTYNFFKQFIKALSNADRISLIDIYPARERQEEWDKKISSMMLFDELKKLKKDVYYAGKSEDIARSLTDKINTDEITCFIGAGDMDRYYGQIIEKKKTVNKKI